jgi:multiple sugar transport system substrate-binding protein
MRGSAVLLSLLLLLAGCSGGSEPVEPPEHCAEPTGEPVLRIAAGSDLTSGGIRRKLIEDWDSGHKDIDVKIVQLSDDADRQRGQLMAALQAGNQDCYDIVLLDITSTAEFAEQGLISPVGGKLDEDIWPGVRATAEYEGEAWAVPWNTDVGLFYYRADLLGRDRDLSTWKQLEQAVAAFDRAKDDRVVAGLITQLAPYEGLTVNTHEAVWRKEGQIVDGDGMVRVAEPKAVDGLDDLADAFEKAGDGLPLLGPDSLDSDETDSLEHFLQGEALTMRNWPFVLGRLVDGRGKSGDSETAETEYGVAPLPDGAAALGGQNLAIAKNSAHREEARELIDFLTSEDAGRCLYAGGFVPAREQSLEGACDKKLVEGDLPGQDEIPDDLHQQFETALRKSLKKAQPRPVTPYYATVTRDIQRLVHEMLDEAAEENGDPKAGETAEQLSNALKSSMKGH